MQIKKFWVVFFVLIMAISCGKGKKSTDLTPTVTPASGSTIYTSDNITIDFSQSMDPESIDFTGTLSGAGGGAINITWESVDEIENRRATLTAVSQWDGSKPGNLLITAKDLEDNEVELTVNYNVRLKLENYQAADLVLGQPDFESDNGAIPPASASEFVDGKGNIFVSPQGKLFVADNGANRVMVWDTFPTTNGQAANYVIGQSDFDGFGFGNNANQLNAPQACWINDDRLFVVNTSGHSVYVYNTVPTTFGGTANRVIGQDNFGNGTSDCSQEELSSPETFFIAEGKIIVADSSNNRVMVWNALSNVNGAPANLVLGQTNFTSCNANQGGAPTASTMSNPTGIWSDGEKLVVVDNENHRVLIWNTFPTTSGQAADLVLGQPNFTTNENNANANGITDDPSNRNFDTPYLGITSNGTQLFVSDSSNNRVLIWNTFPTQNFQPADLVLGQINFEKNAINSDNIGDDGDPSAKGLKVPVGLWIFQNKLLVRDAENFRMLVFEGQ